MSNNNFGKYQQEDKSDNITSKTKPILLDLINSLQGKKDKNKVVANLAKNFANTNVDLQHSLSRLKKIVIPSIVGSAFIVVMILIFVLPLIINNPCKTVDNSILRIGNNPDDIAINPNTNKIYIATTDLEKNSANIAIIDCGRNIKTADIPLPNNVHPQLAVNNGIIYASDPSSNSISVIDGSSLKNIKEVKVGLHPTGMAVNPNTHNVYVANTGSNTISVIDGSSLKNIKEVKVGINPTDIAVNPMSNKMYVANNGSNTVSIIDGNTDKVIKTIPVGKNPSAISVNEKTSHVYIANRYSNTISVINGDKTDSVINTVSVGKQPMDLVADYDQQKNINKIYVANWKSETISIIDGKTDIVENTIPLGDVRPVSMTVDPESHNLFLNTLDFSYGGTEAEINATTVPSYPKYIQVGDDPQYIAANPTTHKVYVANAGSNTVSVIDGGSNKVIRSVIGINGHLAVNNQTNKIYVANAGSNTISVIDGKTDSLLSNEAKVGLHPTDVAVNPKTDKIYVANAGSNTISVIDGNNLKNIKNVTVGLHPTDVAVNPISHKIYVANAGSNTISVIDGNNLKNINNLTSPEEVRINQFTDMIVDPKTNTIYVSSEIRDQFFVINGSKDSVEPSSKFIQQNSTGTIFNGGPVSMVFDPNSRIIYAANTYLNSIYGTDQRHFPSFTGKLNIGGFLSDIAVDKDFLYVVNKDYNTVTVNKQ